MHSLIRDILQQQFLALSDLKNITRYMKTIFEQHSFIVSKMK